MDTKALVTAEHKQAYTIYLENRELPAQVSGKFLNRAASRLDFPAVGDYVSVTLHDEGEKAIIHEVLPRKSLLVRKEVWTGKDAQTIAANMDKVFIVMGLDGNYNIARLERMLVAAWDSGAQPVIILTKKDLCAETELEEKTSAVAQAAPCIETVCVSCVSGAGLDGVEKLLGQGTICCFIGSSGVGKSTLLNRLSGCEIAPTREVREDDSRGRHTTTARQLYILPNGAKIIDTPGMRQFCLEYAEEGLDQTFSDIADLAAGCRFKDCSHEAEPGCAVKEALENGTLSQSRMRSYRKAQKEIAHNEMKYDAQKLLEANRKLKARSKLCRNITEIKRHLRQR